MKRRVSLLASLAGLALAGLPAQATTLEKLDLGDLVSRSDKVFRGTVVDVEQGSIRAGGGEIPAVTYRLRVEEMLKGSADSESGGAKFVDVRMVGSIKAPLQVNGRVRSSVFRDVPRLNMGSDYLLFMTPRSEIGLSVTVGLGQGAFDIVRTDKEDMAVNEYNNVGLGLGAGPITYKRLKAAVAAEAGK